MFERGCVMPYVFFAQSSHVVTKDSLITKLRKEERVTSPGNSGFFPYIPVAYSLDVEWNIRKKSREKS